MLGFFDERHVTGLFEYFPTNIRDVVKERLHSRWRRLVEAAEQSSVGAVMLFTRSTTDQLRQRPDAEELIRTVHRVIDRGI